MKTVQKIAISLFALATSLSSAQASEDGAGTSLLSADLGEIKINKIDIGDFHFPKGQKAPIHTHIAPVFGYVSKGTIYYQVEGQEPRLLKTGDAFYEPVGPRILHFDNASEAEEAVFTDFNLQKTGQPFIVFPVPPKEKIGRRAFPTADLGEISANRIDIREQVVDAGPGLDTHSHATPVVGYVADGVLKIKIEGQDAAVVQKGQSFYEPEGKAITAFASATDAPVKVISFFLIKNN